MMLAVARSDGSMTTLSVMIWWIMGVGPLAMPSLAGPSGESSRRYLMVRIANGDVREEFIATARLILQPGRNCGWYL